MSATATQPLLPDPQTAYDHLFQGVHQNVFFNKLAAAGYGYETPEQATHLLNLAGHLRRVQDEERVKSAGDAPDPYAAALAHLEGAATAAGFSGVKTAAAQERDWAIKQAAADLMQYPELYNSVLALKAADADAAGGR